MLIFLVKRCYSHRRSDLLRAARRSILICLRTFRVFSEQRKKTLWLFLLFFCMLPDCKIGWLIWTCCWRSHDDIVRSTAVLEVRVCAWTLPDRNDRVIIETVLVRVILFVVHSKVRWVFRAKNKWIDIIKKLTESGYSSLQKKKVPCIIRPRIHGRICWRDFDVVHIENGGTLIGPVMGHTHCRIQIWCTFWACLWPDWKVVRIQRIRCLFLIASERFSLIQVDLSDFICLPTRNWKKFKCCAFNNDHFLRLHLNVISMFSPR